MDSSHSPTTTPEKMLGDVTALFAAVVAVVAEEEEVRDGAVGVAAAPVANEVV
jgi:hypothetical protein